MKYLIAQGLKKRAVFRKKGQLTGFENAQTGEGVKKVYNEPTPAQQMGGAVVRKPLMSIKPLKFKF